MITTDKLNTIIEKAKTKKDGVYSHNGTAYLVINNHIRAFTSYPNVYELVYGFSVNIGTYKECWDDKKTLKIIFSRIK
jgi:hypothetical protein